MSKVNTIPVLTWNWLKLNGAAVDSAGGTAEYVIDVAEGKKRTAVIHVTGNTHTRVHAGKFSRVHIVKTQLADSNITIIDDMDIVCEEGAAADLTQVILGGKATYAQVVTHLIGRGAAFNSDTAYMLRGDELLDMNHLVTHTAPSTKCTMRVAGSVADKAVKVYRGTIDLRHGCAGAKGDEQEEVLLLSPAAVNRSIPIILCDEEDVEGEHGASIGRLDAAALFYMQSRGISGEAARAIISKARVLRVSALIEDEAERARVEEYLNGV